MRKALIVWGGWPGHEPEQGAQLVGAMLGEDGFEVSITPDFTALGAPAVHEMDLVIPIVTGEILAKEAAENLAAAVRSGVGLAGYHGALATSFPGVRAFSYVAGVQFIAHPGNIIDFSVEIDRPDDPIVAGIGNFAYRSEQYYLHYDPSVTILASTIFSGEHDPVTRGVKMPVVLKRQFERGRVFYTALGHVTAEFENEKMRTILRRGLNWAARQAVP